MEESAGEMGAPEEGDVFRFFLIYQGYILFVRAPVAFF